MTEGKLKLLRVSRRFELSRVQVTECRITVKYMMEIQGKSILVRVSMRFKLARVQDIRSRLYWLVHSFQISLN